MGSSASSRAPPRKELLLSTVGTVAAEAWLMQGERAGGHGRAENRGVCEPGAKPDNAPAVRASLHDARGPLGDA